MKAINMPHPAEQTYNIFDNNHEEIPLAINIEHQGHFTPDLHNTSIIPLNNIPDNDRLASLIQLLCDVPDLQQTIELKSFFNHPCKKCGADVTFDHVYRPDATHIQLHANSACAYPHGRPDLPITLSVPSGKIFIANDLRDLADGLAHARYTPIDMNIVTQEETRRYAQAGILCWFVGNTDPILYHPQPDTLVVQAQNQQTAQPIGKITTDLWWVCAMDYEHARAQYAKQKNPRHGWEDYIRDGYIIDVPPGNYGTHIAEPSVDYTSGKPKPITIQRTDNVTPFVPPTAIETSSSTRQ